MEKIKFLDISGINCWLVNLKPFPSGTDKNTIDDFQKKCIFQHKIFGMGWPAEIENGTLLKDGKSNYLKRQETHDKHRAIEKAADSFNEVRCGDIVMTRTREGYYYIGKVATEAKHDDQYDRLSWFCEVQEWYEFKTDKNLPTEICGRLSNRYQSTIVKLDKYRQKLLLIAAYEKKSDDIVLSTRVPKIRLTQDNFARSLNYMELEDLVCAYMYEHTREEYPNANYILLPSSGKSSRPKYEFDFVSADEKAITCQVKNQANIDISKYESDSYDIYEKIYIFSAKGAEEGYEGNTTRENIIKIDPKELFESLCKFGYMRYVRDKLSEYYCINQSYPSIEQIEEKLTNSNKWERTETEKDLGEWKYNLSSVEEIDNKSVTRWVLFEHDCFFYSEDFGCFIISEQNKNNRRIEQSLREIFN